MSTVHQYLMLLHFTQASYVLFIIIIIIMYEVVLLAEVFFNNSTIKYRVE